MEAKSLSIFTHIIGLRGWAMYKVQVTFKEIRCLDPCQDSRNPPQCIHFNCLDPCQDSRNPTQGIHSIVLDQHKDLLHGICFILLDQHKDLFHGIHSSRLHTHQAGTRLYQGKCSVCSGECLTPLLSSPHLRHSLLSRPHRMLGSAGLMRWHRVALGHRMTL